MNQKSEVFEQLKDQGYSIFTFQNRQPLDQLRSILTGHKDYQRLIDSSVQFDDYAVTLKTILDQILASNLIPGLFKSEASLITQLLGPDVDIQKAPHLRVSRAAKKTDVTGWHRDYYYGNSPFEVNFWFPLLDVPEGAGLRLLPGSHREKPNGVAHIENMDQYFAERKVERGSTANFLGFVYAPKTEELIQKINNGEIETKLLAPKYGDCIVFFSNCLHTGETSEVGPRISIDLRLKNHFSPTETKPGFYEELLRGPVFNNASQFLQSL